MIQLKVCGMKFPDNIEEVSELAPQYLGFIFYEGSPRFFQEEIPEIDPGIKRTGVFVNATVPFILGQVKKHKLQAIQLHGEETSQFCKDLRKEISDKEIEIFKVFSIADHFSFDQLRPYEGKVNFFLFDTSGKTRGGTGKTFNWNLLLNYDSPTPFFLSGGIGLAEAEKIIELKQDLDNRRLGFLFYGIDVNSRFESFPGRKLGKDLKEFRRKLQGILQTNQKEN